MCRSNLNFMVFSWRHTCNYNYFTIGRGSITEFGLGEVTYAQASQHTVIILLMKYWPTMYMYNYRYIMEKDWKLLHVHDAVTSTHFL